MTKGRNKNFVKSSLAVFQDVSLDVSDLQAEVSRFRGRIFHCFPYFIKI